MRKDQSRSAQGRRNIVAGTLVTGLLLVSPAAFAQDAAPQPPPAAPAAEGGRAAAPRPAPREINWVGVRQPVWPPSNANGRHTYGTPVVLVGPGGESPLAATRRLDPSMQPRGPLAHGARPCRFLRALERRPPAGVPRSSLLGDLAPVVGVPLDRRRVRVTDVDPFRRR